MTPDGLKPDGLKGAVVTLNGDRWTVVDVAPAEPLAEMVAAILEDEGILSVVRGADPLDDVYSHLGGSRVGTTVVLVPEPDAARAFEIIAETVTDYQGAELDELLATGELSEHGGAGAIADEDEDDEDGDQDDDEPRSGAEEDGPRT
ncbi:MAG: DUF2007 domain-containing protein [Trueperaceae bacterium]|nr:DUF2007 domain-containing protein [Trueperaceae bacterium]